LQAGWITNARRKDPAATRGEVDLENYRAPVFDFQSVFAGVAVGADADIELAAIRAR
jgi:hypothetical protein